MDYVYAAIFSSADEGGYTASFPDLPGCYSQGDTLGEVLKMTQSALAQWIQYLTDKQIEIPLASSPNEIEVVEGEFVNLIRAEIKDNRAVRRNVSIPKWMDEKVAKSGLSLSRILQDALVEKLA